MVQHPKASVDLFIADHCVDVPETDVDAFVAKVRQLKSINQKLDAIQNTNRDAYDSETTQSLRIHDLRSGTIPIPGYTLVSRLGGGGFGEVWKAMGPGGFQVALKFVPLHERSGRIERRALDVIKDIRHANLLSHFGAWTIKDLLVIAMELADKTLLDRLREAQATGGEGIPLDELLRYMDEAAKGVDFLNEPSTTGRLQVQHRDIKPQNLLLSGGSVKIGDFGLARSLVSDSTTHTGSMTMAYAAPECFDGTTSYRSDQYSLAITYCYLRSGRLPFDGTQFEIIEGHRCKRPDLGMLPKCERVAVAKALEKHPNDRWQNSAAFIQSLRSSIEHPDLPEQTVELKVKSKSRRQAYVWSAVIMTATGLVYTLPTLLKFDGLKNSDTNPIREVEGDISPNNGDGSIGVVGNDQTDLAKTEAVPLKPVTETIPFAKPYHDPKSRKDNVVTSEDASEFLRDAK